MVLRVQGDRVLRAISLIVLACVVALFATTPAHAEGSYAPGTIATSISKVREAIQALSADPTEFSASDKERVEAIQADFDALSAENQATLDAECSHSGTKQPLGRVLEAALWAVWSYNDIDDSTTLGNGTYNAATTPALSSEYSKGKSTSSRQKPWSVKSVQVVDGHATATVTVQSDSYTHLWMGGVSYPDNTYPDGWKNLGTTSATRKSGNCEFEGVPIDLNSTFYFAGVSASMPTPIAFSLTTWIDEPGKDPSSDDEERVNAVKDLIAALPGDPKSLIRQTDNEEVAAAASAYEALPSALKAKLSSAERMHLAMCAIIILPSDAFKLTKEHGGAIAAAQHVYETLTPDERQALDSTRARSSTSYGRYLESASWALDGLRTVNNVTLLKAGTYTNQVKSTTSNGKGASGHSTTFTVKSVTVKGGKATAILEHSSDKSEYLLMGGVKYENKQTDPKKHSYFEVPIELNSTFHFSIMNKDARDETDAIVFEMTTSADTDNMKPDAVNPDSGKDTKDTKDENGGSGAIDKSKSGGGNGGSGQSGNTGGIDSNASGNTTSSNGSGTQSNLNNVASNTSTKAQSNLNNLTSTATKNASTTTSAQTTASKSGVLSDTEEKTSASANTQASSTNDTFNDSSLAADGQVPGAGVDLLPAIAGLMLLAVSLGMLLFTIRFISREKAMPRRGPSGADASAPIAAQ